MDIKEVISRLERLMHGYNYQVTMGVDVFEGTTIKDFEAALKDKYPGSKPDENVYTAIKYDEFLAEIKYGFNYRGDETAGLVLKKEKEEVLKDMQLMYVELLKQYINSDSTIYGYSSDEGIPGYPVWWDYRFVVLTTTNKVIFVYGCASD